MSSWGAFTLNPNSHPFGTVTVFSLGTALPTQEVRIPQLRTNKSGQPQIPFPVVRDSDRDSHYPHSEETCFLVKPGNTDFQAA